MTELTKLSAVELSEKLQKKEVSAEEVTKSHFERIEKLDNKVKSFLYLDKEGAIAQAKEVDKRRKDNQITLIFPISLEVRSRLRMP